MTTTMTSSRISDLLPEQNLGGGRTRQGFHGYQWDGIDRIHTEFRIVLADQPGLGKTFQILGTLERAGLLERSNTVSLVLAPKIVAQIGWKREVERFVTPAYPDLRVLYVHEGSGTQKRKVLQEGLALDAFRYRPPVLIIANHNAIDFKPGKPIRVPELLQPVYDAIIIDEAHLVLPTRVNADAADRTQFWHGLSVLRDHPMQYRVAVSGTTDRGKLENRLGYWRFLRPTDLRYRSFWGWVNSTFRTYDRVVNRRGTKVRMIEQKPLDMIAWLAMDKAHVLRRTKAEVLPELPPKQYMNIEGEMSKRMVAAYARYEADLLDEADRLAGLGMPESASALQMKMYLRGRQLATCEWDYTTTVGHGHRSEHGVPLPAEEGDAWKLDWLVQFLREREEGQKVVIASDFTQVLDWVAVHLVAALPELQLAVLSGDTSDTSRFAIEEDFQRGTLQVVLLSQSIGVGITLDAADDLVLVDVPKDPDKVEQVEDRVHRAGSFHQVTIWRLISVGTMDVKVVKAQDATYAKLRAISDHSRGVDNRRKMLNKVTGKATR
jgi:hypothetical protein